MKNIITISGNLGSGKSTMGKILSENLNLSVYASGDVMRHLAQKKNMDINEFVEFLSSHKEYDALIDNEVANIAKEKNNLLFVSRMAWYFIPQSFKVFLYVDESVGAERIINDKLRNAEKYLSYEITYPVLNKNIKDKSFVQYIDYQCYWCGYNRPTSDPSDSYKGEPYDLQIYHKEWELPADIEKQNISEITYTVYNKPGTFVNEYQQAKIVRQAQSNGGYNPSPYITISGDCNDIVYLAVIAEYYGRADDNENSSILYQNSFNDTIIGVKVKYNDESVKEAYYILEFNENMPPKESDKMFILYRLTLEE